MTKFVILDNDEITNKIKGRNTPINFGDEQSFLRVNEENENELRKYKKYSLGEMRAIDFDSIVKRIQPKTILPQTLNAFGSKYHNDGSKLYEHIHGVSELINGNETGNIRFKIPYKRCFLNEIEVVGGSLDTDVADFYFQVSDGAGGFFTIIQHGHSVNLAKDFYRRKSSYEAELTDTLYLNCVIKNNSSKAIKYGINIILHEVK